jgi:hypothetical protein
MQMRRRKSKIQEEKARRGQTRGMAEAREGSDGGRRKRKRKRRKKRRAKLRRKKMSLMTICCR